MKSLRGFGQRGLAARVITLTLALAIVLGGSDVGATDYQIPTSLTLIKFGRVPPAAPVGRSYKFVSKPPRTSRPSSFTLPSSDPIAEGGSLTVTMAWGELYCDLQPGLWDGHRGWIGLGVPAGAKGYKYMNRGAPGTDPCRIVIVKERVIKVLARATGSLPVPLDNPPGNPDIGMTLVLGADSYCAYARAPHSKATDKRLIRAKNQEVSASCSYPQPPRCGSATAPECDGACPPEAAACIAVGLSCTCADVAGACGEMAGAPECWGTCGEGEACFSAGDSCLCHASPPTTTTWPGTSTTGPPTTTTVPATTTTARPTTTTVAASTTTTGAPPTSTTSPPTTTTVPPTTSTMATSTTTITVVVTTTTTSTLPSVPWRFIVAGDTQLNREPRRDVVEGVMTRTSGDFAWLIIPGDLTHNATESEYQDWIADMSPLSLDYTWSSDPPFRRFNASFGNHEGDNVSRFLAYFPGHRNRSAYAGIPGSPDGLYGSFRYRNVLVVWLARYATPSSQEQFMAETAAAAANDPDLTWRFIHWHYPPAGCNGHESDDVSDDWVDDHFLPAGFDIGWYGHNHNYVRTCPMIDVSEKICGADGFHVITSGSAGGDLRGCGCPTWVTKCRSQYGFIEVTIQDATLTHRFFSVSNGQGSPSNPYLEDEFTIVKGPPLPTTTTTTTTLPPTPTILDIRADSSSDDAEEYANGTVTTTSSDLEMVYHNGRRTVGIRFKNLDCPPGSAILDSYVQFKVDETSSGATTLTIHGQAADNAPTFTSSNGNVSNRATTIASVSWSPPAWNSRGASGPDQRTPNLAAIIQEIVDRPAWFFGNSLVLIITGDSSSNDESRIAESYNGDPNGAPLLHVVCTPP